jgi:hypothetical protein
MSGCRLSSGNCAATQSAINVDEFMSQARSLLFTAHDGPSSGPPFLVLHERYGSLDSARVLGQLLGSTAFRVAVRSVRLQTTGGDGETYGFYWYVGPEEQPELSTLGDGLYQLELLLLQIFRDSGYKKIGLLGAGEGGVVALLMGLVRPELISIVVAIDAHLPINFASIPIEIPALDDLPVLLVQRENATGSETMKSLTKLGAKVTALQGDVDPEYVSAAARS